MTNSLLCSYSFCETLSQKEAKNFYYSFRLLPTDRRRSMCALYAFMRQTDDLADEPGDTLAKADSLRTWRNDLDSSLEGKQDLWPGLLALVDTVRRYGISVRHLHDVIDGVEMDLTPRLYETFDDLYSYCYRVASAVGLCCLSVWGYQSHAGRAESMAESCGIALQLTNILRDVGEDARNARVYLPQVDLRRFGVRIEDLKNSALSEETTALFKFQADRAYQYYEKAAPLMRYVNPIGRPVLGAITGIYEGLLNEIVRRDYDVLKTRVSLSAWTKSWIALSALPSRFGRLAPRLSETTL